jgi:hypothetical protein
VSLDSWRFMNPPVPLDLGDFFFCKRYGHLMGWSTLVNLGHMTSWTWSHDVLDLDYDVLDKTRRYVEKDQDKSQDKMLMWSDRIVIFELTSTIKRPRLQRRGWGWLQSIRGLPFLLAPTPFLLLHPLNFCYIHMIQYTHNTCYQHLEATLRESCNHFSGLWRTNQYGIFASKGWVTYFVLSCLLQRFFFCKCYGSLIGLIKN